MVNMRPFNEFEEKNLKFLVNHDVKFTQVEITPTGLGKGILDSTAPMRAFFLEEGIHNYEEQLQGPEHKLMYRTVILTENGKCETQSSFYRPVTKKGDPRMWIYKLGQYTKGNDIHVLFHFNKTLFAINITHIDIEKCCNSVIVTPLKEIINEIYHIENAVSEELLGKFRSVSGQWFESEVKADTGIGRTLETFLGIPMNSKKTPDYKGIELKSHREKRSSKKNGLFTHAPNWELSNLKSGREITEKYGYINSKGFLTLQNTVQCHKPNSQDLFLNVNNDEEWLELLAQKSEIEDVAVWKLIDLHSHFMSKHRETFWVAVDNEVVDGKEYFRYKEIEHTRNPILGQFDVLLDQNMITMDLILCRPSGSGDTYSFKIKKKAMPLLFPESVKYVV